MKQFFPDTRQVHIEIVIACTRPDQTQARQNSSIEEAIWAQVAHQVKRPAVEGKVSFLQLVDIGHNNPQMRPHANDTNRTHCLLI